MLKDIGKDELWVLSYYRASELAGALFFGRLARRTKDDELRIFFTEHFAEEARHAWLWTEAIKKVGYAPLDITETYQSAYSREIGIPTTMPEVLLLTKIFEERIYDHFSKHKERKEIHPVIKETLNKMLEDEKGHLEWVDERLKSYDTSGVTNIKELYSKYKSIDEKIYLEALAYENRLWDFLAIKK